MLGRMLPTSFSRSARAVSSAIMGHRPPSPLPNKAEKSGELKPCWLFICGTSHDVTSTGRQGKCFDAQIFRGVVLTERELFAP